MPEPKNDYLGDYPKSPDVATIVTASREMREVRPEVIDPSKVTVYRDSDGTVAELNLEDRLPRPERARGTHQPGDLDSLIALIKDLDATAVATVWVHPTSGAVEAVLDDHEALGTPGHGDHRAWLNLQQTPAWKKWLAHDETWLTQASFAEHIEARIPDIAEPDGATLMEIITTLTGKTEVNWGSGRRLQDGSVQLTYTEEATASAGRGQNLDIPQRFTLMIQPFVGLDDRVPITARLRYRLNGGDVKLGYTLDQPEDVLQDAIDNVRDRLRAEFPRVYVGSPR